MSANCTFLATSAVCFLEGRAGLRLFELFEVADLLDANPLGDPLRPEENLLAEARPHLGGVERSADLDRTAAPRDAGHEGALQLRRGDDGPARLGGILVGARGTIAWVSPFSLAVIWWKRVTARRSSGSVNLTGVGPDTFRRPSLSRVRPSMRSPQEVRWNPTGRPFFATLFRRTERKEEGPFRPAFRPLRTIR
jgi:hypothetical protein